ncbi:hypothetical protein G7Y89_g7584 [Cudoniella acicularis]|uniref:Heterokaryon incompatibility domain-containing protein n=1 Tax=Cudoniella acicularis TaxID=354080 RepID=A0A8H4W1T9_9HELO|nr:hypothetical protein G7Y89_g7584 [Cudoniella acicularis]
MPACMDSLKDYLKVKTGVSPKSPIPENSEGFNSSSLEVRHELPSSGDFSFTLPPDVAKAIKDLLDDKNTCPAFGSIDSPKLSEKLSVKAPQERVPPNILECEATDFRELLDETLIGGRLASLFNGVQAGAIAVAQQPPQLRDENDRNSFSAGLQYASCVLPQNRPNVTSDIIQDMSTILLFVTRYYILYNTSLTTITQHARKVFVAELTEFLKPIFGGKTILPGSSLLGIIPHGGDISPKCLTGDSIIRTGDPPAYKVALNRERDTTMFTIGSFGPSSHFSIGHQNIVARVREKWPGPKQLRPDQCQDWDGLLDENLCGGSLDASIDGCMTASVLAKGARPTMAVLPGKSVLIITLLTYIEYISSKRWWEMVDDFLELSHDTTNVRLGYPAGGNFRWSTGWTGQANSQNYFHEYWCDEVLGAAPNTPAAWKILREMGVMVLAGNSIPSLEARAAAMGTYCNKVVHNGCRIAELLNRCTHFNLLFIIQCAEVIIDDPLSNLILGRPLYDRSDSDSCFEMTSQWLEICKSEHKFCSWNDNHVLPARIINVGSDSKDPFLVTTNGETGSWATLSHCWGGEVSITTTNETLELRQRGIPMEDLPRSFQDAVIFTRKLGLKYIWIDSLCIIQDSRDDWNRESVKMYDIYSYAAINISAAAAKNARETIFKSRSESKLQPLITIPCFSNKKKLQGSVSIRHCTCGTGVYREPLHRRAWVLQESILSPRRIDFASDQVYWTCRTNARSEAFPLEETYDIEILIVSPRDLFRMPLGEYEPHPQIHSIGPYNTPMSWWSKSQHLYFHREVTINDDLLPAIAGIAAKIAERTGYTYKAGLWAEDFHRGLLWQASHPSEKIEATTVPSWSWASRKHPWHPRFLFLEVYRPGFRANILEVDVETCNGSPFSQVISASLKMESFCRPLGFWKGENRPVYNVSHHQRLFNKYLLDEDLRGEEKPIPSGRVLCTLDAECEDNEEQHEEFVRRSVVCLQIARFGHSSHRFEHHPREFVEEHVNTVFALLLEPTGKGESEYVRIGIAEIPQEEGMADGWDTMTVTVV